MPVIYFFKFEVEKSLVRSKTEYITLPKKKNIEHFGVKNCCVILLAIFKVKFYFEVSILQKVIPLKFFMDSKCERVKSKIKLNFNRKNASLDIKVIVCD